MDTKNENEKLIEELKLIISEYEQRLNSKDKNFQLQFSELQNELLIKYSEIEILTENWNKAEFQITELKDLVQEKNSVIESKECAIKIMESDLKDRLENVKVQFEEMLSVRQEEIECLRMTCNQLREQLSLSENDVVTMMERHEDQIVKMSQNNSKDNVPSYDQATNILKEEIKDIKELLFQKQEALKMASSELEEQDKTIRQLTDRNVSLMEETNRLKDDIKDSQKDKSNDDIKENKNRHLSLKAKVKSLEKQLESLKSLSIKDQENNINLNKKIDQREQLIEKQNTLIDELRQTEINLRQSLERVSFLQQEQMSELCYWKDLQNNSLSDILEDHSDDFYSLTPLQLAIDSLDGLLDDKNKGICENIKDIIIKVKSHIEDICQEISRGKSREMKVNFVQAYVTKVHQYNLDLLKQSKLILPHKVVETEETINEGDFIDLSNCSRENLLLKIQILTQDMVNYSERINKLEYDQLHMTIAMDNIRESNNHKSKWFEEKKSLDTTVAALRNDVVTKDENLSALNKQIGFIISEEDKFKKEIKKLKEDIICKKKKVNDKVEHCFYLEEQLSSVNMMLEEARINVEDMKIKRDISEKHNFDLSESIKQLEDENLLKEIEKGEISEQLQELIVGSEKSSIVIEQLREDVLVKEKSYNEGYEKWKVTLEKNEELMVREKELNDYISSKEEDIKGKENKCQDLNEEITVLKLKLEEITVLDSEKSHTLLMIRNENEELIKEREKFNEDILLRTNTEEESVKELKSIMEEKETLLKTITQLKEDILLKDESYNKGYEKWKVTLEKNEELMVREKELNDYISSKEEDIKGKERKCQDLNEEITILKLNVEELTVLDSEKSHTLLMIRNENEELLKEKEKFNEDISLRNNTEEESMKELKSILEEKDKLMKAKEEELSINNWEVQEKINILVEENDELMKSIIKSKEEIRLKNIKYNETYNKTNLLLEEKEELSSIIAQLSEEILSKDKKYEELYDESKLVNIKLEEKEYLSKEIENLKVDLSFRKDQNDALNEELRCLIKENDELLLNFEELKDVGFLRDKDKSHLNDRLMIVYREKEDLLREMNQLKDELLFLKQNQKDQEDLCLDQNVKLKEFIIERNELHHKLTSVFDEKEDLLKEIRRYQEDKYLRNKEKEDMLNTLESTIAEKEKLFKITEEFKTTMMLTEQNNLKKDDIIQKLEKSNLLLKAKSLKMKKQYDEKLATLLSQVEVKPQFLTPEFTLESSMKTTKSKEDLINTSRSVSLDTSDLMSNSLSTYSMSSGYTYDVVSPDEISFVNRIQSFSDEVDSRARQANLEIEKFLERNEEVTTSLSPDITSHRKSLCENPQCLRNSLKNRDLLISVERLREQNELMKNKIIDLKSCLEYEKEIHQQINKEGITIHEELLEKLSKLTSEKHELKLQLVSSQCFLKESEDLLIEKENMVGKVNQDLTQWKRMFDSGNRDLREKDVEIIHLKEGLQGAQNSIEILMKENADIFNHINGMNEHINNILVKQEHSCKESINLYPKKKIHYENVGKLEENINKLESLFVKTYTDLVNFQEEVICSIKVFVETLKNDFLKVSFQCTQKIDDRFGLMRKSNYLLEENLITILRRMDRIINECSLEKDVYLKDKIDLDLSIKGESNEKWEMTNVKLDGAMMNIDVITYEEENLNEFEMKVEDSQGELEYFHDDIDNESRKIEKLKEVINYLKKEIEYYQKLELDNNNIPFNCGNCIILVEKIERFRTILEKLISDIIPTFEQDIVTNMGGNDLITYCDMIKGVFIEKYEPKEVINQNTQTVLENSHLTKMDDLIQLIMNEFVETGRKVEKSGFELWFDEISEIRNQMITLRDELKLEVQEKSELSDKFEKIFIELEKSCDSEIEELKGTIISLNTEIESLQLKKETYKSSTKDYKVQLSYLQAQIDNKSEKLSEKEEIIPLTSSENPQFWLSDLNDALKETISEKEDHITELMDRINVSSNRFREFVVKSEEQELKIKQLESDIEYLGHDGKRKGKLLQENNDVINELEAVCVEKENRINFLEKESAEINVQLEQYVSAICSMEARLEASKPNLEFILTKIENKDNYMQLLNLIDQLEKDYAEELEQSEINKGKIESKLNRAIQIIHKLKKQLKESHSKEVILGEELRTVKLECHCKKVYAVSILNPILKDGNATGLLSLQDVSVQIEDDDLKLLRDENVHFKGIIENLHVNNFLLLKELDNVRNVERNIRESSLPLMNSSAMSSNSVAIESERSSSPVSQLSFNSIEGNSTNSCQFKDLQRKVQRVHQQLNQMRIERNRIHQEYSRIRQLKEVADSKVVELTKKIDSAEYHEDILSEKDELLKTNNLYSTQIVELNSEIEMTKVRNSILETKCKKIELKLSSQRRKYDQLVLRLDEKEHEIDRGSDELRRHISNFENEKLNWLRERKAIKSLLNTKDEKIDNLRKRLSNKSKVGESCDTEFLLEITQLETNLNDQILENKRISTQGKEQTAKCQGQIEELIDENRQLKRKLSLVYNENNKKVMESKKNESYMMDVIEEDSEESLVTFGSIKCDEKKTILATVVMEKERLLSEILDLRNSLQNEKDISYHLEEEIQKFINDKSNKDKADALTQSLDESYGFKNAVLKNECYTMTERIQETAAYTCTSSTIECHEFKDEFSETNLDFDMFYKQQFRKEQLDKNVDKSQQINIRNNNFKTSESQTEEYKEIRPLQNYVVHSSTSGESVLNERFMMDVIEEESEESLANLGSSNSDGMKGIIPKVIMEKEKLLSEISILHHSIQDEKEISYHLEEEIEKLSLEQLVKDKTMKESYCSRNSVLLENCYSMLERSVETKASTHTFSTQTSQTNEFKEEFSETDADFDMFYKQQFRKEQLNKNVDKSQQINIINNNFKTSETQTEEYKVVDCLQKYVLHNLCSSGVQTTEDNRVIVLKQEIHNKNNVIEQYVRQIFNNSQQAIKLKCDINEISKSLVTLENQNFEYQEAISLLELEQIDKEKKYKENIAQLNSQVEQLVQQIVCLENSGVEVTDKADQTMLHQPANEGWDMEWDYEKLTVEYHSQKVGDIQVNVCGDENTRSIKTISDGSENSFLHEENISLERSVTPNNIQNDLIEILKDEIIQIKNVINEKNIEIGKLKCLRNKLENELLESCQQIKDSNMEFLNLKENVQVLHAEREMLQNKVDEVEDQFSEMINFIEMVTADLRRLRATNSDSKNIRVINEHVEDSRVKRIVRDLEDELHKLLELFQSKELKLELALFQIEQLSCTIHRLQLQQARPHDTLDIMNVQETNDQCVMTPPFNIHDECIISINELSQLNEKKHLEIEGLKSRLFLATDQLIHFRTFFANPENMLHKELLLITRHHGLGFNESDRSTQLSSKDHTKLNIDNDDQSDIDQSLISHDGNTVIRIERAHCPTPRRPYGFWFLNYILGSARYKRVVHNFKRVFLAGRCNAVFLRSQPRINFKAILTIYLVVIHLLLLWCLMM